MKELLPLPWNEFFIQNIKWSVAIILRMLPIFFLVFIFYGMKQCGCVSYNNTGTEYSIVDDTIINTSDKSQLTEVREKNISELNSLLKHLKEKSEKNTIIDH